MHNILIVICIAGVFQYGIGQSPDQVMKDKSEIFNTLQTSDSLLFRAVFDDCDSTILKTLISDDLEFFHDQSGITNSKSDFIKSIRQLCQMAYKPRRELDAGTLIVFPLYNNGKLYGAIQTGEHRFFAWDGGVEPEYLTSTARFTHVWLLEKDTWKLNTVLSYDHQPAEKH
jgi:hypothetical protein